MKTISKMIGCTAALIVIGSITNRASAQTFAPEATRYTAVNFDHFYTTGSQSLSGSAKGQFGETLVSATGTVSATGGASVEGGYSYNFTNAAYPEFAGPYTFFDIGANYAPGPDPSIATFHIDFSQALPDGSYVAIMDVDTGVLGEFGKLLNFGPDAYMGTITNFGHSFNNSPAVSYVDGEWLVQSGYGGNSPQELNFFDASGITSLDYVGGFSNPSSGGQAWNQLVVWVPVPEPSVCLLSSLSLFLFIARRQRYHPCRL